MPGAVLWSKGYGGITDQEGNTVALDPAGNVIIGGYTSTAIDFGCGTQPSAAGDTPYVAKLTASGNCIWSRVFTITQLSITNQVKAVATDALGNVFFGITYFGAVDLGGGVLTSAGASDIAVGKLDPSGAHLWSKRYGNPSPQTFTSIATDPAGNVILAGYFAGNVDFGGGAMFSAGSNDIFVVKLSTTGNHIWSKRFGDPGNQVAQWVDVDAAGNVLVAGAMTGTVDFGGGPRTSAGLGDPFIVKLDPAGNHLWSKSFAGPNDDGANWVKADSAGNVVLTGAFGGGSISFGGATFTSQGGSDIWVAKLDPAGNHLWSKALGGAGVQGALTLAVDPSDNVIIGGVFDGSTDFGGGVLTSAGSSDMFMVKYTPSGGFLWARQFGSGNLDLLRAMTAAPNGDILITGFGNSAVDFGLGPVGGFGGEDVFLVRVGP